MSALRSSRQGIGRCMLVAAAVLTTSAAVADERPAALAGAQPAAPAGDRVPGAVRWRLASERLAPSVSVELEAFTVFRDIGGRDGSMSDHVLFDQLNEQVRSGAKSATRRTVRNYLLETMGLERGLDRMREGLGGSAGKALDFRFGIHSADPEVGLRYRMQPGSLRLDMRLDGMMGVHFRFADMERAEIGAVYDGDDQVEVRARLGF